MTSVEQAMHLITWISVSTSEGFDRRHYRYSHLSALRDNRDLCCYLLIEIGLGHFVTFVHLAILVTRLERVTVPRDD